MAGKAQSKSNGHAVLGFEAKLWQAEDKLRNNMDAAEHKHVVLGLIFLKYIPDTFDQRHTNLVAGKGADDGAYPTIRPLIIGAIRAALPSEPKILHASRAESRIPATLRNALQPRPPSGELSAGETDH